MKENDHEWFWALDLDALIMNSTIKAETFLDDNYDLIVNDDCNGFNAGNFFIKNSAWSLEYLTQVLAWTKPEPDFYREQAAMMNVRDANAGYEKHFKWVDPKLHNSYIAPGACNEYKPGDFVIHFAGKSLTPNYVELFESYYKNSTLA